MFGAGGALLDENLFSYDDKAGAFIPLSWNVPWDKVQELAIVVDLKYDIRVPMTKDGGGKHGTGKYKFSQRWRVNYKDKGIVLDKALLEHNLGPGRGGWHEGEFAVAVEVTTDQPSAERMLTSATLLLTFVGGFKDEGITVSVKAVSGNVGSSAGTYSKSYKLEVALHAVGKPKPAIELPEDLLNHTVLFEQEDQSDLSTDDVKSLEREWVDPVLRWKDAVLQRPVIAEAIKNGSCTVFLAGYASVTGKSAEYNKKLSEKRMLSVQNALTALFVSSNIKFMQSALGSSTAKQPGPSPQERRVRISIPGAEKAIEQARN